MPTYTVKIPDGGGTFVVKGPAGLSSEQILDLPDRVFPEPSASNDVSTGEIAARGALQGTTFGLGDELMAGVTSLIDTARNPDQKLGEAYDARLLGERNRLDFARQRNPVLAYGSEVAGSLPTAFATTPAKVPQLFKGLMGARAAAPAARAASNPAARLSTYAAPGVAAPARAVTPARAAARTASGTIGERLALGAGGGAAQGGIYGAGQGEGGIVERGKAAATNAALGGILGLAVPALGTGVRKVAQIRAERAGGKELGMTRSAYNSLNSARAADETVLGPGGVAQSIKAGGPDAMVADAGPNLAGLLDTVAEKAGPGAAVALNRLEQRAGRAAEQVTKSLDDTLGTPEGINRVAKEISRATAAPRKEAYDAAYKVPIDYASETGRAIEDVFGRMSSRMRSKAIEEANEAMLSDGVPRARQILLDEAGEFVELPGTMQADYIKRALNVVGAEIDELGRATAGAKRAQKLARQLRKAMGEQNPAYDLAVKLGGDKIEQDIGLKLGRDMLKPSRPATEVADEIAALRHNDEAMAAARQGLRTYIDTTVANVKMRLVDSAKGGGPEAAQAAQEAVRALKDLSSRASRDKISALLGDDVAKPLFEMLDQAGQSFGLQSRIGGGSQTFRRLMTDQAVGGDSVGAIDALATRGLVPAAVAGVKGLFGRGGPYARGREAATYTDMANVLTGGPDQLARLGASAGTTAARMKAGSAAGTRAGSLFAVPAARAGAEELDKMKLFGP